jgi:glycosyltransferase involved in cell wall biosynthesis
LGSVVWIGRFGGYTGFSTSTRLYFQALQQYLPDLHGASLEVLTKDDPLASVMLDLAAIEDLKPPPFKVINHLPTTDPEADAYFSVCEYNRIPDTWVECFNQAKIVLTQSKFCQKVFAAQIDKPEKIHVIPYIIDRQFSPTGSVDRLFPKDICVFGSIFEWNPRKCPERMLKAFITEFSPNEPVRFILRTYSHKIPDLSNWIRNNFPDPRILVINDDIPDIAAFYRGLDGYLSPTAGEAWGQTLSEAMACGIPTIGSKHSGNLDFMTDKNSYLVDVEDWSSTEAGSLFHWRLPKIPSIQHAMREIFKYWQERSPNPKIKAALRVRDIFTSSRVGRLIYQALKPWVEI